MNSHSSPTSSCTGPACPSLLVVPNAYEYPPSHRYVIVTPSNPVVPSLCTTCTFTGFVDGTADAIGRSADIASASRAAATTQYSLRCGVPTRRAAVRSLLAIPIHPPPGATLRHDARTSPGQLSEVTTVRPPGTHGGRKRPARGSPAVTATRNRGNTDPRAGKPRNQITTPAARSARPLPFRTRILLVLTTRSRRKPSKNEEITPLPPHSCPTFTPPAARRPRNASATGLEPAQDERRIDT